MKIFNTIYVLCLVIWIHLCDNFGEIKPDALFRKDRSYAVRNLTYIVSSSFADNGLTLSECFQNLLQTQNPILTEPQSGVKMKSEYVSAVGKENNEKDSK